MESQKSVQTFTYFTPSLRVLSHGLGISHRGEGGQALVVKTTRSF